MDTVLLVLAASPQPMLASALAALTARPATAVRATLQRLSEVGLVRGRQVDSRGPTGTWEWTVTDTGRAAAERVLSFVRGRRS